MTGITVGQAGDVLVAVKQAHDPDHRARLRHEADLLGRLDHPGVVRLIDFDEGPPAALRTAFVGPDSWRTSTASAAAFAALTATIADLHDSGLAHGDLRADHVLLDGELRPILCGFAAAGPATAERMQADRAALAAMLRDEATRQPTGTGHRMRDAAGALDEPALPTRAAIRLLDEQAPAAPTPRRSRPGRTTIVIAAGVLAVIVVAAFAVVAAMRAPAPPIAVDEPATPAGPPPRPEPAPTTSLGSPVANSVDAGEPATVVVHDGRRYAVGAPGDLVHVADWDCSGESTPAVLRPNTGELAVFTAWPGPAGSLLPAFTATVDGALDFLVDDRPCPELRVRTSTGSRLIEVPA
ncbi:MAG: hypothetical protein AAGA90_09550 [Actinomycetota bacterium]